MSATSFSQGHGIPGWHECGVGGQLSSPGEGDPGVSVAGEPCPQDPRRNRASFSSPLPCLQAPTLHHPPASSLQNPDGSKVCRAAESPGLGPLGALDLQTGGVGWDDRHTGQRNTKPLAQAGHLCQECPPHPAGTCVTYSISTHLCALEGVRLRD